MSIVQCMGGWCMKRTSCEHYVVDATPGRAPVERMCAPGVDTPEPIRTRWQRLAAIKPLGRPLSDGSPARAHSGEVAP